MTTTPDPSRSAGTAPAGWTGGPPRTAVRPRGAPLSFDRVDSGPTAPAELDLVGCPHPRNCHDHAVSYLPEHDELSDHLNQGGPSVASVAADAERSLCLGEPADDAGTLEALPSRGAERRAVAAAGAAGIRTRIYTPEEIADWEARNTLPPPADDPAAARYWAARRKEERRRARIAAAVSGRKP